VELQAGRERRLTVEYRPLRIDAQVQLVWAPPAPHLRDEAVDAARSADVAVLVLGLSPRLEGEEMPVRVPGFSGGDRVSLGLPAPQEELLEAVVATGTPVVLVLTSGSPLAVTWAAEHVPAIVQAWYPGEEGGDALADVLLRGRSPGGRLPVTVYRSADDLPAFSDYAMRGRTYRYFRGTPLYPFGHGLSYTRFRYRDLRVPGDVRAGDDVPVSVEVENAGDVPADEVVQLYVTDVEASVSTPVRSLAGFARISLDPRERRRISFTVPGRAFSLIDRSGRRVVEPGAFELSVGGKQPGQRGAGDAATTEVRTARIEVR
jgi:beta-glucosidase